MFYYIKNKYLIILFFLIIVFKKDQSILNQTILDETNNQFDFSECVQRTFLRWAPCFYLWIIGPFWIYSLVKKRNNQLKHSLLFFTKIVIDKLFIKKPKYSSLKPNFILTFYGT